nr:Transposon, En/Spm-like protein [Ipomoea batatas]
MLHDLGRGNTEYFDQFNGQNEGTDAPRDNPTSPNKEAAKFYRLLLELEQELYPGCKESSTLSFIVELLNWKCLYGISANAVDGVLKIMKKWFPTAYEPDRRIYRYKSILVNGWRFNTKDRDLQLKSQNSEILVKGDADTASQAEQVYYVSDIKEPNWHVVVKTKPRDFYDLPDDVVEDEPCQENENFGFTIQGSNLEDDNNVTVLHRPDLDATTVEVSSSNINTMSIEEDETDSDGDAFINDDDEIPTTEDEEVYDDD